MQFKRFAQARGQQALVCIASLKFGRVRSSQTAAVTLQRRVRVFLAMSRKRQTLADLAHQLRLTSAAVKVQAFARCNVARKNYMRERTQGLAYAKLMVRKHFLWPILAATSHLFIVVILCNTIFSICSK